MWENSGLSELSGSVGSTRRAVGAAHGGSVRMFGVAATGGRIERRAARRLSSWTRDYLRGVALADLGCAAVGVFMAAQVRSGDNVTSAYQVYGGLDDVTAMVKARNVDTVAVTACAQMDGITLRRIAWDLERLARTCAFRPVCLPSRGLRTTVRPTVAAHPRQSRCCSRGRSLLMAVSAYADTSAINEFRMTIYPKSDGCARSAAPSWSPERSGQPACLNIRENK